MVSSSLLQECSRDTLIPSSTNPTFIQKPTTERRRSSSSDFGLLLKDSSTNTPHNQNNIKTTTRSPYPCLASEELKRECLQTLFRSTKEEEDEDSGFTVQNTTTTAANAGSIKVKAQEKEEEEMEKEVLTASKRVYINIQKDTDDVHTLVAALRVCIEERDLQTGSRMHANIVSRGFLRDNILLGNTLINLYAKCGALAKAQEVCDKLPFRTVVSWNVLIAGYANHGSGDDALHCLEQMQLEGLSPDAVTFTCVLKACVSIGAIHKVQELHAQIEKEGLLENDVVVGTVLVDTYAKLGFLAKAQEVFDKLLGCDAISWNVLISGHAQHGHGEEALNCFEQMQLQGFSPNEVTFLGALKACATIGVVHNGQEVHAHLVKLGMDGKDIVVANALIDMYVKYGLLTDAEEVFEKLPVRDVVSFGGLITGYAQHGRGEEAIVCFERLQPEGVSPNVVTFVSVLKACGIMEAVNKGLQIHSEIVREGVLETDTLVSRALLDMYAKCGLLEEAQEMFDRLPDRDVFSFNLLIADYSQHGYNEEALGCFERMQLEGLSPNAVTFVCILKVCASIGAAEKGQQIHDQIVLCGSLETDLVVGTTLVDLYANCGLLAKAQEVFDKLPVRDVISWNALIGGFSQHGHGEEAIDRYDRMKLEGLAPDAVTFVCILKACGSIGVAYQGLEIHAEIVKRGFLGEDPVIGTALVDMYAKCGLLVEAQEVFDGLPVRDVVSWNALITEYAQSGYDEEALSCVQQMQLDGLSPNTFTFSSVLKACSSLGAIYIGQGIHVKIMKEGLLERDIIVSNALVDMYSNFGMLGKAQEVFDNLVVRDVVSWNALMGGFAQLGNAKIVFQVFDKMKEEGIAPDMVTFTIVLNTCSHTGLLDEGQGYFETMSAAYCVFPNSDHHTCIVDLFGRAGHLDKVVAVIKEMPFSANATMWLVVLGACQRWGNTILGRLAFQHAARLDKKDASAYISLGNMY